MIHEQEALVFLKDMSPVEKEITGRFVHLNNGNTRMFIFWIETFNIFDDGTGKLNFADTKSSRLAPYVFVNRESKYYPVSWPEEWGMMHVASSYMEEVYQRTIFT